MIFGTSNPQKILHQYLIDLPTSLVCCSHFILGNPKSHFSTILFICIIRSSHYLRYLRFVTLTVIVNLPITPEKISPQYLVNCRNHSSDWRYIVSLQTLVALKTASCGVWQLEATSQQVFKVTTFCIIVHHALLIIIPRLNKLLPQVVRIADRYLVFARSCSMPQMQ